MQIICAFSSSVFLINSAVAYLYIRDKIYSVLFLKLFITSIIFHNRNNIYTNILDKVSIIGIIIYGGKQFYEKLHQILYGNDIYPSYIFVGKVYLSSIIIASFLSTLHLYSYGYCYNQYCFYKDKIIANRYHALLHIISCMGHLFIMIL